MPAPGACGQKMLPSLMRTRALRSNNDYLSLVFFFFFFLAINSQAANALTFGLQIGGKISAAENNAMATVHSASKASSLPVLEFLLLIRTEPFSLVYSP